MITIDNIKDQYILPTLAETGFSFNIVTDVGDYQKNRRNRNTATNIINGLLMLTQSEIQPLSNGLSAIAYQAMITFLIPLDDAEVNEYPSVTAFRNALSSAFSKSAKIAVTDNEGKAYEGGVVYSLPAVGQRNQRDMAGDSVTYTCTISVAFLQGALNISDFALIIDNEHVAFSSIRITRTPVLMADLLSSNQNAGSSTYAESAAFKIEFAVPALNNNTFSANVLNNIFGSKSANAPMQVSLARFDGVDDMEGEPIYEYLYSGQMIFAGCEMSGSGVSNVGFNVSLVPYTESEEISG